MIIKLTKLVKYNLAHKQRDMDVNFNLTKKAVPL